MLKRWINKASQTRSNRLTSALVVGCLALLLIGGANRALSPELANSYNCGAYGESVYGGCLYDGEPTTTTTTVGTQPPVTQPPVTKPPVTKPPTTKPPTTRPPREGSTTTQPDGTTATVVSDETVTSAPTSTQPGSNDIVATPGNGSDDGSDNGDSGPGDNAGNAGSKGNVGGRGPSTGRSIVAFIGNPLHRFAVAAEVAFPGSVGTTIGKTIDIAGHVTFPLLLALLVYLFLLIEHRIDKSDPKLVAAKLREDDEPVEFR